MNAVSMESARTQRNHPARCLAVGPHVHVAIFETVGSEDRAYVRPVVVAVVQRLEEHDAEVQPELSVAVLRVDHIIGGDASGSFDELIPAAFGDQPEGADARELILLMDLRLVPDHASQVPLLSAQQVLQRRGDGAVRPRSGELQLLIAQPGANVEQVEVGPLVVAKRFNQRRPHDAESSARPAERRLQNLVSCQGMALDTLQARGRTLWTPVCARSAWLCSRPTSTSRSSRTSSSVSGPGFWAPRSLPA